jgi:hypothetical protein
MIATKRILLEAEAFTGLLKEKWGNSIGLFYFVTAGGICDRNPSYRKFWSFKK